MIYLRTVDRMKEPVKKMLDIKYDKKQGQQAKKAQHDITKIHQKIKKWVIDRGTLDSVEETEKSTVEKEKIKYPDRAIIKLKEINDIAFDIVAYI